MRKKNVRQEAQKPVDLRGLKDKTNLQSFLYKLKKNHHTWQDTGSALKEEHTMRKKPAMLVKA
jgi:hypothetical protein